jgi:hypothetical protein
MPKTKAKVKAQIREAKLSDQAENDTSDIWGPSKWDLEPLFREAGH